MSYWYEYLEGTNGSQLSIFTHLEYCYWYEYLEGTNDSQLPKSPYVTYMWRWATTNNIALTYICPLGILWCFSSLFNSYCKRCRSFDKSYWDTYLSRVAVKPHLIGVGLYAISTMFRKLIPTYHICLERSTSLRQFEVNLYFWGSP